MKAPPQLWLVLNALLWLGVGAAAAKVIRPQRATAADVDARAIAAYERLELSPEQRDQIDTVLAAYQAQVRTRYDEYCRSLAELERATDGQIRELLSDEQRIQLVGELGGAATKGQ